MLQMAIYPLVLTGLVLSVLGSSPAQSQVIYEDLKLTTSGGAASDEFGISISIDDGIVAVGVYLDDDNGSGSGSAYLFDAYSGAQLFKLLPNDGRFGDQFGISIAIDNGVVAVGAFEDDDNGSISGSAYVFDASTGAQIVKLLPNDGAAFELFGNSIAIHNGIVAVGAYRDDNTGIGFSSGSVYLFDASTGTQLYKLLPSDGASNDEFGTSLAIDNGIVAVGAIADDDNGFNSGSAYLFDASTGAQIFKLLPSDGEANESFGRSIAIDNGIVAIGMSRDDDSGDLSGSAYLFNASTGRQIAKVLPSDGMEYDNFGYSISIDNGDIVVGAPGDDDSGSNSGSAYVFTVSALCVADLTGEGILDFFDISAFLSAFASNDPIADFTGEGIFDFFDVSAFLSAFSAGCP